MDQDEIVYQNHRAHLQALSSDRQVISIASAGKHGPRCVATWSRIDSEASRQVSLLSTILS